MTALAAIQETPGLHDYLEELEEQLEQTVHSYDGLVAAVSADALNAGGKRLRPLLVFFATPRQYGIIQDALRRWDDAEAVAFLFVGDRRIFPDFGARLFGRFHSRAADGEIGIIERAAAGDVAQDLARERVEGLECLLMLNGDFFEAVEVDVAREILRASDLHKPKKEEYEDCDAVHFL